MNPYKIMLVDDEEEVRTSIIRKIDWQDAGFEVIGDAENGKEALEKIEHIWTGWRWRRIYGRDIRPSRS